MKYWRINLILVFIILFSVIVISKLFFLQVLHQDFYSALAQGQQKLFNLCQGERGKIFLKDGELLATNIYKEFVYICPKEVKCKEETAEAISQILGLDQDLVLEKTQRDSLFEPIKRKLTEAEANSLREINLPGVYLNEESWRYYPQGSLASHAIGFLSATGKGQYGIEGFYDDTLRGKEGFQTKEKGALGYFVSSLSQEDHLEGADVVLTLDYNIQFAVEKLLEKACEERQFKEVSVIVMNPNDGRILALVNYPDFNPNQYFQEKNLEVFQNPIVQRVFEPGSVFKPFTIAAALNQGKITPYTTYIDEGYVRVGGYNIHNYLHSVHGEVTMTKVLEDSINTGAVFAEQQIGGNTFLEYINKFGIFEPTGIDLQGEVVSENEEFKKGYKAGFATASFGQGIEMTPIQLVRAFSVIANGGDLVKPYLVEKIIENGKVTELKPEITNRSIISQKTVSELTAMLVSVVENGFGKPTKIPGYYIAGKTGTAQISWSALGEDRPGYSQSTFKSFIGFAPAFNPKFLILLRFSEPKIYSSEYSLMAIFKKITKFIIDYYSIPPDYEQD